MARARDSKGRYVKTRSRPKKVSRRRVSGGSGNDVIIMQEGPGGWSAAPRRRQKRAKGKGYRGPTSIGRAIWALVGGAAAVFVAGYATKAIADAKAAGKDPGVLERWPIMLAFAGVALQGRVGWQVASAALGAGGVGAALAVSRVVSERDPTMPALTVTTGTPAALPAPGASGGRLAAASPDDYTLMQAARLVGSKRALARQRMEDGFGAGRLLSGEVGDPTARAMDAWARELRGR